VGAGEKKIASQRLTLFGRKVYFAVKAFAEKENWVVI
jgi:hypothetical protein